MPSKNGIINLILSCTDHTCEPSVDLHLPRTVCSVLVQRQGVRSVLGMIVALRVCVIRAGRKVVPALTSPSIDTWPTPGPPRQGKARHPLRRSGSIRNALTGMHRMFGCWFARAAGSSATFSTSQNESGGWSPVIVRSCQQPSLSRALGVCGLSNDALLTQTQTHTQTHTDTDRHRHRHRYRHRHRHTQSVAGFVEQSCFAQQCQTHADAPVRLAHKPVWAVITPAYQAVLHAQNRIVSPVSTVQSEGTGSATEAGSKRFNC
eukprot:COSAG03_NODE_2711_length_2506_cov_18.433319_3_plen_262_part_00